MMDLSVANNRLEVNERDRNDAVGMRFRTGDALVIDLSQQCVRSTEIDDEHFLSSPRLFDFVALFNLLFLLFVFE